MNNVARILLLAAAAAASSCQLAKPSYSLHDPRIVGTWYSADADPAEVHEHFEKTYFPDGTACGYIFSVDSDGAIHLIVFESLWEIKNGQLLSTVIASNSPNDLPPSRRPIVDHIVFINDSAMRLRDVSELKGNVYTEYRLHADKPQNLCRLFHAVVKGGAAVKL